jgi:hypothetical protein
MVYSGTAQFPAMRILHAARYLEAGASPALAELILNDLHYFSFEKAAAFYALAVPAMTDADLALLGANDRYFLLTVLLRRHDMVRPWFYDRAREVEADPDDYLDLWARGHGKSSIGTFAGAIQEIVRDPEITIGIFSGTNAIAQPFLAQIKEELEGNELLKRVYADVFWADPAREAPIWSRTDGIVVRRKGNPKEATVEAHGLVEALPVGRHFKLRIYDDLIDEKLVTNPDVIKKVTARWELSQNLSAGIHGRRKWHFGTRYSFADSYGILLERGILKPRIYPATHDGTLKGIPVLMSPEQWEEEKRNQRGTIAAQMLLNPVAGEESSFMVEWLRPYELRPPLLNVYIVGDPSLGRGRSSDRTAIAVIGIDATSNRYLLDGYCHRMKLSARWRALRELYEKWRNAPGVQAVHVGWERYGLQADTEYFEEKIVEGRIEGIGEIMELNWTREGPQSKKARVDRLEPYFRNSQFWMPPKVWYDGKVCTWKAPAPGGETGRNISYSPWQGPSRAERAAIEAGERYRVMEPIRRLDEDGNIYDLFRVFVEEFSFFPFSPRDDLIDAVSRVEDMRPVPPMTIERGAWEMPTYVDS